MAPSSQELVPPRNPGLFSFATLLGLELAPNGDVEVLALGDSVAFHLRADQLLSSFPYTSPEQFDARPLLLSTLAANNSFIGDAGFFGRNTSLSWSIRAGDIILLATDAVSQWALLEREPGHEALRFMCDVESAEDFEAKVLTLRQEKRMRIDDSTLIRLLVEE